MIKYSRTKNQMLKMEKTILIRVTESCQRLKIIKNLS